MATFIEQLANHIKKNLKKGYTLDALRFSLINQGYTRLSVEKAIELTNIQLAIELPKIKEKPEIIYKVFDENKKFIIKPKKRFADLLKFFKWA